MVGVQNVQMDVFFFVGDYMKYDFDILERGKLVQILESHKQLMGTLNEMGMLESIEDEYDQEAIDKIIDYFIEKMKSESSRVNVDELNVDEMTGEDSNE